MTMHLMTSAESTALLALEDWIREGCPATGKFRVALEQAGQSMVTEADERDNRDAIADAAE